MAAQLLHDGERIGHLTAAQGNAPELRDAVGHLCIQTGGADGGGKAEAGVHQVDAHRPAGQLGIQVQKLLFGAEGTQKVVSAAKGQTADSRVLVPIGTGESFVERTVTACRIDAQGLPCLPGLPGSRIRKLPGVTCVGGDLNGICFRGKARAGSRRFDLLRQGAGAVGLAGSGIQ